MEWVKLINIGIGALFINNIVFSRLWGLFPLFGGSKNSTHALGMGGAVTAVTTAATMLLWFINRYLFIPYDCRYLQTIVFALVVAALVLFMEMAAQKYFPLFYESAGSYFPLLTTNCITLAITIGAVDPGAYRGQPYTMVDGIIHAVMSGVGFSIALLLMVNITQRLDLSEIPRPLRGLPITFIVAGLLAMAFLGFGGLTFMPIHAGGLP